MGNSTLTLTLTLLLICGSAQAGEQKIDPSALPAAVTAGVQKHLPGARIVAAARDDGNFEAEVVLGKRRLDVAFTPDGTWLEDEERIGKTALPAAVQATLASRWKGWSVERAEKVSTPEGHSFELIIEHGEETREVVLDEAGAVKKVLDEEDEENDDEENDGRERD